MTDEHKRRDAGEDIRDGVRTIVGVVGALKDAVEETFQDLLERGELSPERAREAARSTVKKAQDTVDQMRDRLDVVPRREFDALRAEVAALRRMLEEHRARSADGGHGGAAGGAEGSATSPPDTGEAAPEKPRFPIDEA